MEVGGRVVRKNREREREERGGGKRQRVERVRKSSRHKKVLE